MACCICKNSYDLPARICAKCRRDPANAEWVRHVDGETDADEAVFVVDTWQPDETDRKIARAIVLGRLSYRAAAKDVGCTLARVVAFVDSIMISKERMRRVWPERNGQTSETEACTHPSWQARSDLGRGCYTCSACGLGGRRSVSRGTVTSNVRHPGHRLPSVTVDFKAFEEPPEAFIGEGRTLMRPLHSNRHDVLDDGDCLEIPEHADDEA